MNRVDQGRRKGWLCRERHLQGRRDGRWDGRWGGRWERDRTARQWRPDGEVAGGNVEDMEAER